MISGSTGCKRLSDDINCSVYISSGPPILRGGGEQQAAGAGAGELLGQQARAAARQDTVLLRIDRHTDRHYRIIDVIYL